MRRISTVLALCALAVSVYLAVAHLLDPELLVCSASGAVNCTKVTTSAQSIIVGVPVAYLGVVWSLAMVALCLPAAWRSTTRWIAPARLALAVSGVAFVLWLVYAELFLIHAICLWCTAMHALTFALFVVVVLAWTADPDASASRGDR